MKKILVIDDEENIIKLLGIRLKRAGYEVISDLDGYNAVKLAIEHKVDLIILDVLMPGISGLDVCKNIKANKELKDVPVVLLTALASINSKSEGMSSGADAYLTKPYDSEELLATIAKFL